MPLAALAYGGPVAGLHAAACAVPADLYIAHYVAALPAAGAAAQRHGALLGFDAEDFHSGEGMARRPRHGAWRWCASSRARGCRAAGI